MWKDKADRVCRFCKDVFCCAKCRDRHVNKMHFGLNADCCLCAFEILPIRYGEFMKLNLRDEELLNHIVEKHLPLHCQLCGDLYKSKEDFKSFDKCKWWSQFSLSPIGLEQKLKQYCISNYNGICTPPELQRKTSTPMLGQKASFETPCVPYFSLKTPKTNSPINAQISQNSGICGITEFFSFSHISNEDTTPFRTFKDEQSSKSNSGRKLNIMQEGDETADNKAEKITADETVHMNLTKAEGGILESPASNVCEESDRTSDIVKKVRFSDQHETVSKCEDSIKSCVKITLNASTEEEKFHDAHEISSTPSAKNPEDANIKDTNIKDTMKIVQDIESTKDNQVEIKKCSFEKPLRNFLVDLQNDMKNTEKENQNPEIKDEDSSAMCRQESSTVLITVLMESNSGDLNTDLIPLINSGLKKLQEQLASTNQSSSEVESTDTINLPKKSITRMQMSVENVESYSTKHPTDCRQIVPSSSLSMQNVKNNNGFFAAVAQAMKYALKSFSGLGIPASNNQVTTTEVIEQRKIIEESTSTSLESSTNHSIQLRPNKRAREIAEVTSTQVDSAAMDIQSPLAKRQKGWYTMIKARQPIHRMRNRYTATSSKGVQVFSQGSLTVGDTVLPLPVRAHQSTQTE